MGDVLFVVGVLLSPMAAGGGGRSNPGRVLSGAATVIPDPEPGSAGVNSSPATTSPLSATTAGRVGAVGNSGTAAVSVAGVGSVVAVSAGGVVVAPTAGGADGMGRPASSGMAMEAAGASVFSVTVEVFFWAPALGAMGVDGIGTEAPVEPFAVGNEPGNGGSEKSVGCACAWRHQPTVISVTNLSCLAITSIIYSIR